MHREGSGKQSIIKFRVAVTMETITRNGKGSNIVAMSEIMKITAADGKGYNTAAVSERIKQLC